MIVRRLEDLKAEGGTKTVGAGQVKTVRYLLSDDGAGFSVSDVTVPSQMDMVLQYKNHVEVNVILGGEGTVEDLATGEVHELKPGMIYVVFPQDRHRLRIENGMHVISIFNPPLIGTENHDADGSYLAPPGT